MNCKPHPTLHAVILFFAFFLTTQLEAKIRLLTFHYNLPELIEIQVKTLNKFIEDDFELIVFNDAKDPNVEQKIHETCDKYNILCIRYEPEWHLIDPLNDKFNAWTSDPNIYSHIGRFIPDWPKSHPHLHVSVRHCHVLQYALDHFGYHHDDIVGVIDGDCFPIRPVNLRNLINDNHIAGIRKYVVEDNLDYLWVVFTIFNPNTIPHKEDLNFQIDLINNKVHDTGSHTYHFLNDHPDVRCLKFPGEQSAGFYHWNVRELKKYGFNPAEISLIRDLDSLKNFSWPITVEFHVNNRFVHLGNSASNLPGYEEKMNCVRRFLKTIIKE